MRPAGLEHPARGVRGIGQGLSDPPTHDPKKTLARGLKRSCPICGNRKIFSSYFKLKDACSRCGYRFSREEGYWVGAVIMNTAVTEGLFLVLFIVAIIAMAPDIDWVLLVVIGVATNLIFPVLFYPFSKTIWMAFDLVFMKRANGCEGGWRGLGPGSRSAENRQRRGNLVGGGLFGAAETDSRQVCGLTTTSRL
ncbi:MAG: DUF983 domain-containing protein [Actinomycetota bacterium]